jgi:lysine biosynthesis protein LysW
MEPTVKNRTAYCPTCGERPLVENKLILGQIVRCCFCQSDLEVLKLDPVVLDWPIRTTENNHNLKNMLDLDEWVVA